MTNNHKLDGQNNVPLEIGELPIRGEHRVLTVPADPNLFPTTFPGISGIDPSFNFRDNLDFLDFVYSRAKDTLTDFINVKINGRKDSQGRDLIFRFLINPESLSVSRDVIDAQSYTRGGWQFGVWGANLIKITGKATTAGQYFAETLTDGLSEYTASYNNLLSFITLFENNGYWFEGERADDGPLASSFLRRRIKKHSDVVFKAGNFVWHGMFQSASINETSDTPYFNTFTFDFIAWKERFVGDSPWGAAEGARSERYLGHAFEVLNVDPLTRQDKQALLDTKLPNVILKDNISDSYGFRTDNVLYSYNGQPILKDNLGTNISGLGFNSEVPLFSEAQRLNR